MRTVRWVVVVMTGWLTGAFGDPVPMNVVGDMRQARRLASEGRREDALKIVAQSLTTLRSGDHVGETAYGDLLCNAAKIRRECGDYDGGLEAARLALQAARERKDDNNHAMGLAYFAIAMCEASLKHRERSETAATAGWEALGRVPYKDPKVPNLIPRCSTLTNLAGVYHGMEDYLMAEKYYRLAARDGDRLMGFPPQDVSYDLGKFGAAGRAFSSIGGFYVSVGDHRRAIPYLERSLATRAKAGPSSSSMGREDTYMNLSRAYLALGDTRKADDFSRQAVLAASRGTINTRQVIAMGTRGAVRASEGRYDEALELMEQMAERFRQLRNDPSFEHPSVVNNIGWMQLRLKRYQDAKKTLTHAYTLAKRSGMERSELAGNILFSLAELEFLAGDAHRGLLGLQKAIAIYEDDLKRVVGFGSESQKLAYLERLRGKTDFVIGVHFGRFRANEPLARESLQLLFQRKDRMTQLTRNSAVLTRKAPAGHATRRAVDDMRSRLGLLNLSLGVFDRNEALEIGQDWMVDLEREMRVLSEKARPAGTSHEKAVTIEDVVKTLGDHEVLVEYVVYRPYEPELPKSKKHTLPLRCGVFVLDAQGTVRSRDLGEYETIQTTAIALRRALAQPGSDKYRDLSKTLHAKLVAPVMALSGDATSWKIAPDGQLHLIPFEALTASDGSFLAERLTTSYVATGADLARATPRKQGSGGMVIVAGPDYGMRHPRPAPQDTDRTVPAPLKQFWMEISELGAPLQFPPLPGTLREAEMIRTSIPDCKIVTGKNAKEGVFRELEGVRLLHIATHGFYLDEHTISTKGQRGLKRVKPAPRPPSEVAAGETSWTGQRSLDHPLLNCGLSFAGANHLYDGHDDGVLTGMEVLAMDLTQTDLVVLSACETGVGKVLNGEGVLGLRQAFRVAGAQSMVMSLWKVHDEATAELMGHFYQLLADGRPRGAALREAAARLRSQERWSHPAYWSAFLLSGADGPL